MKLTYLGIAAVLGAGMAVTQHYALLHYWYWSYPWLDLVMHFSGGVVITLIAVAYVGAGLRAFLIMITIGILWEVYEFVIGISVAELNFVTDSLVDLGMDVVGGLFVCGMMRVWEKYRLRLPVERAESPDQTS